MMHDIAMNKIKRTCIHSRKGNLVILITDVNEYSIAKYYQ